MTTKHVARFDQIAAAISLMPKAERHDRAWMASRELAGYRLSPRFLLAFVATYGYLGRDGISTIDPQSLGIDCGIPADAINDILAELEGLGFLLLTAADDVRGMLVTFPTFVRRPIAERISLSKRAATSTESHTQH